MEGTMRRIASIVVAVLMVVTLAAGLIVSAQTPTPGAYSNSCFRENGMEVAASGCVKEWQSGSSLIVRSGATVTFAGLPSFAAGLSIAAPTAQATGVPAVKINNQGSVANSLEVDVNGTPVWSISASGVESTGHPEDFTNHIKVAAPTSIATATPAAVVDSLGVSRLFEVRDAATPVWGLDNGGAWTATGVGTNNNQLIVSAPTAIATAQPAFYVDSLGVSRLFEVRDAATPVVGVRNGGRLWVGKGLYGAVGTIACTHGAALPDFTTNLVVTITASGTPTPNDFTVGDAGTFVTLIGPPGSDTCTITRGAKMALGAATRTLGANDSIILVSDGTSWNEVAFTAGATS